MSVSAQDLVNHLLTQELAEFNPHNPEESVTNRLAKFKYPDRQSAERALAWAIKFLKTHYKELMAKKEFISGTARWPV